MAEGAGLLSSLLLAVDDGGVCVTLLIQIWEWFSPFFVVVFFRGGVLG